jgi:hypothetical protein
MVIEVINTAKRFIIFSPSYNENVGGIIVLHKLCDLLNELGYEAYLYPFFDNIEINVKNLFKPLKIIFKSYFRYKIKPFKTNPSFNTPLFCKNTNFNSSGYIIVYPEIVFGNPLNGKNVVRWFLHKPGFHTGKIYYGRGEFLIDFNCFANDFCYPYSRFSGNKLNVVHFPLEYYNLDGALGYEERQGTAYCLRKGKHKKIIHDLSDSVLVDGKSHKEIALIFKRVKSFISYDSNTAYSIFASLCGADSIVVPDDNVPVCDWYPNIEDRYGVAYGFENVNFARETRGMLLERVIKSEERSKTSVKNFAVEAVNFFEKQHIHSII